MIAATISHYRILERLGAGGMGEVYLAEDTRLDRKVAIKFLPVESTGDEQAKKRLIREAKAAAKLDHPNICAIHEVGEEDNRTFIVMQYVEGETLASRIKRKTLRLKESLDIAVQVADALAEAHSRSIIHRDIKPAPTSLNEYDAITNTVQHYITGGKSGRTEEMKRAFHPDATIFGYIGSDLFAGQIQQLFDWNDRNGPAAELQGRITSIDLVDTIATVRLELDNWTGHRFTDMFTLLKVDGEWKIMNKVFHLHP